MNTLDNIDNTQTSNMIHNQENVQEGLYSYIKNILSYSIITYSLNIKSKIFLLILAPLSIYISIIVSS